jgi:large subunit ribosomal protein L15
MKLYELAPSPGSKKRPKRVGCGLGSGHGKTCCRGAKGQRARSGGGVSPSFEGGQMPLIRRLPKRGFTNVFKKRYATINIRDLNRFESGSTVDADILLKSGLIKRLENGIKVLGQGEITRPLILRVSKITRGARRKIEEAGGNIEVV